MRVQELSIVSANGIEAIPADSIPESCVKCTGGPAVNALHSEDRDLAVAPISGAFNAGVQSSNN